MANQPPPDRVFFDYLASDEVEKAHEIEKSGLAFVEICASVIQNLVQHILLKKPGR